MFDKLPFKKLRYKKADLPSNKINDFVLPAITCTTENNGISCYVKKENATIFKNCISVAANGDAPVFYQSNEFTILQDAYVIDFKDKKLNKKENLFFTALLKKALKKFDWANKSSWERVKNENILLPTTHNGEIDFEFMESFVAELEAERVAELEAYLAAASLKDYELTAAELSALSKFENYNWGEFRIGDYFKKVNLKNVKFDKRSDTNSEKTEKYNLPLVNAKHGDNGIMFYGSSDIFDFTEMSICIVQNGAVATGDVYPQPQKTGVLWDAYLIKWANIESNNEILFYATTAIHKTIKQKFSYDFKATWERVKKEKIYLPTNNGDIDFEFMNNFIKAIEKLVIKDVVLYADNKIKATKSIVSSNQ